ncbi:hypothetical protein [Polaribacter sp. Asnod1-A03]|uniref:hypothetical protein n=1 Tax=Polaribacter sp. Asnod1-A03 TaxID=3160581 RepID=UPI003866CF06
MKIGIICEGHTDRAVIQNILKGLKGIDSSEIAALRPDLSVDETDRSQMSEDNFSNWSLVKSECENQEKIDRFLSIEGNDFVVIQIDADMSDEYGVPKPIKDANYSDKMRNSIIIKIDEWLDNNYKDHILYAIALEETEAWILTIYDTKDSTKSADPKAKLKRTLSKMSISYSQTHSGFSDISKKFSKEKNFTKGKFRDYNKSLDEFCKEIEQKIIV